MHYDFICKKNCVFKENGSCKLKYDLKNSVIPGEPKPCIYYSSKKNMETPLPQQLFSYQNLF